ncbi:hypothetical protein AMS68_001333 [Peltaster fructicola]|uniref:Uncharacterized protein n=1 Tax=Peltaster fructicola TaxID=286661 RepID=A0A6H0XM83_9PEZI|nr:hypothetical protein AMS68_001333 [Peltaster fructicola]
MSRRAERALVAGTSGTTLNLQQQEGRDQAGPSTIIDGHGEIYKTSDEVRSKLTSRSKRQECKRLEGAIVLSELNSFFTASISCVSCQIVPYDLDQLF